MEEKIKEIVLTGGPCAGKTTGLSYISEKLMDYGFRVFLVPEVATIFIKGGINDISEIFKNDPEKYQKIEERMVLTQRALRREYNELANIFDGKKVIIFDRGEMDAMAYISEKFFKAILEDNHLTLKDVRDSYDAVIHLITAANGAREFYTTDNNEARRESAEEALIADEKTLNAWIGHPHLRIIDNATDFEGKMKRLLKTIARALDIPVPLEIERKFLVKMVQFNNKEIESLNSGQKILIEQMYLDSKEGEEVRIRKRSQNGSSTYYKTWKAKQSCHGRPEKEKIISAVDYFELQKLRDKTKKIIKKNRLCFVYNNQYFELDDFLAPINLLMLEIELTEENDKVELPPFFEIEKEVTNDPKYSNYEIANGIIEKC